MLLSSNNCLIETRFLLAMAVAKSDHVFPSNRLIEAGIILAIAVVGPFTSNRVIEAAMDGYCQQPHCDRDGRLSLGN